MLIVTHAHVYTYTVHNTNTEGVGGGNWGGGRRLRGETGGGGGGGRVMFPYHTQRVIIISREVSRRLRVVVINCSVPFKHSPTRSENYVNLSGTDSKF